MVMMIMIRGSITIQARFQLLDNTHDGDDAVL